MQQAIAIAIVGSGPAGCYLAQALRRSLPDAVITIFDRLASPFGLVRYGVAPDHQGTKSIQGQFSRLFERDNVSFAGNVEVGVDVTLDELRKTHHVVALATGLSRDRALGVPGENLPGVYGAGQITRILNTHPLETPTLPKLGRSVAIVGGGNVSLDIVRCLTKSSADFDGSDINDEALLNYEATPVTHIDLVCRSSAGTAPFDLAMLTELGKIDGVQFLCSDPYGTEDSATPAAVARAAVLAELFSPKRCTDPRVTVRVHFGWAPTRILGHNKAEALEVRSRQDQLLLRTIGSDSIITAIGFDFDPEGGEPGLAAANLETGIVEDGLYRTGWAKRGSKGTIPENRLCAKAVAAEILRDLARLPASEKPGFSGLPDSVQSAAVDYQGWLRVDEAERAAAPKGRTRKKKSDHSWMLTVAQDAVRT